MIEYETSSSLIKFSLKAIGIVGLIFFILIGIVIPLTSGNIIGIWSNWLGVTKQSSITGTLAPVQSSTIQDQFLAVQLMEQNISSNSSLYHEGKDVMTQFFKPCYGNQECVLLGNGTDYPDVVFIPITFDMHQRFMILVSPAKNTDLLISPQWTYDANNRLVNGYKPYPTNQINTSFKFMVDVSNVSNLPRYKDTSIPELVIHVGVFKQ